MTTWPLYAINAGLCIICAGLWFHAPELPCAIGGIITASGLVRLMFE